MENHDIYRNGTLIQRTTLDYDAQTLVKWQLVLDVWTQVESRAMTAQEVADQSALDNEKTVNELITQALRANKTFLALASPTNAQAIAQVKALTKQVNGILKLQRREFDTNVDG